MSYYKEHIESIQDFPKEGILYRDIQPLLENHTVFMDAVKDMGRLVDYTHVKYWVGIESRGFIFASAVSYLTSKPLILLRKKNKLPAERHSVDFQLVQDEKSRVILEILKYCGVLIREPEIAQQAA